MLLVGYAQFGKTVYTPLAIPQSIIDYFQKILDTANVIEDPFEQSFFSLVHLPYLQPFVDVNKRVSRLACNIPLIKNNLYPISFVDVSQKTYIDGILGVYELNKTDLLADVFVHAYERSTLRYSEVRNHLTEPDLFLEQYDVLIQNLVHLIVTTKTSKEDAVIKIRKTAEAEVVATDQARFIEVVETALLSLHEGNIGQFNIKLTEFREFAKIWAL